MILSLKEQFLSNLNPNVIYLCLGILVILLVLTIIKKAFKLAVVVVIIGALMYGTVPLAKDFQSKYSIERDDRGAVVIKVDGNEFKFGGDKDEQIKKIEMERQKDGSYDVKIIYNNSNADFNIPGYMRKTIISYIDDLGLKEKLKLLE